MTKTPISETIDRKMRQVRARSGQFTTRTDENGPVIAGYFAVFNSDYEIWPGANEQVAPGAFASSLGGDVRALTDHLTHLVLGRTAAGTLSLREDEHGLYGEIRINEHDSDAMNLYARVQRGDVTQCSFGFDITDEEYISNPDGSCLWIIKDVVLYEVSVCTFPAYAETSVEARRADLDTIRRRSIELRKAKLKERISKC
jgi:HK97 family phage prohead protease